MKINSVNFNFKNGLSKRKSTNYIIIHHRAGDGDVQSIHQTHLNNGWSGIGYHYYVRKDGSIYTGRPEYASGAHTVDYNSQSIGVCFEGNFENEKMKSAQIKSGRELISYLKSKYPNAKVKKHRDFNATACPGKNFPFKEITESKKEYTSVKDIVAQLNKRGIITEIQKWLEKLTPDSNGYWLAYKGVNLTEDISKHKKLVTVNDIVWELNHRGIITDKKLWLNLLEKDTDLYWLARKICNMTKNK